MRMDTNQIVVVTVIVAVIVLFVAAYFGVKKLREYKKIRVGKNGEKKVSKELEKIPANLQTVTASSTTCFCRCMIKRPRSTTL